MFNHYAVTVGGHRDGGVAPRAPTEPFAHTGRPGLLRLW